MAVEAVMRNIVSFSEAAPPPRLVSTFMHYNSQRAIRASPEAEPECRPSNHSWIVSVTSLGVVKVNQLGLGRQREKPCH